MAKVFILEDTLSEIGDAIRAKTGNSALLSPSEMVTAIGGIKTSVTPKISVTKETGKITATAGDATAEYQITESDDKDLVASNILSGVNIFGVNGTAMRVDSGTFTPDADTTTVTFHDGGKETVGFIICLNETEKKQYSVFMMAYLKDCRNLLSYYNQSKTEVHKNNCISVAYDEIAGDTTIATETSVARFKAGVTYHYVRLLK